MERSYTHILFADQTSPLTLILSPEGRGKVPSPLWGEGQDEGGNVSSKVCISVTKFELGSIVLVSRLEARWSKLEDSKPYPSFPLL